MTGTELVPAVSEAVDLVKQKVAEAEARAEAVQVTNEAEATTATKLLRALIKEEKGIEARRREFTDPLNETAKRIKAEFDAQKAPIKAAAKKIRGKVQTWSDAEEERRRKEQERIDREREDRERQERQRREAEEKAARDVLAAKQKEAEEGRQLAAEDSDLEALAEEMTAAAEEALTAADALSALPVPTLPRAVAEAPSTPAGVTRSEHWEFEITDIRRVPDFLPDGTPLKQVMTAALRQYMHDTIKATGVHPLMPGVEFKKTSRLSVRS